MSNALNAEAVQRFDEVKKGKARRFVMICKGPKVLYLAVFKKGQPQPLINEAKKLGHRGVAYVGVVEGKGQDLTFKLSSADGYDSPPVKDQILKSFLVDEAGLKRKPTTQIVPQLELPPEDEADDSESQKSTSASGGDAAEDARRQVKERLDQLNPSIKGFVSANPSRRGELLALLKVAKGFLDGFADAAPDVALRAIADLEELLSSAATAGGGAAEAAEKCARVWTDALGEGTQQVEGLAKVLADYDEPECQRLGRKLPQMIAGRFQGRLEQALHTVATSPESSVAVVRSTLSEYKSLLKSDKVLEMVDENPFAAKMNVRVTLAKALIEVEKAMKNAAA